MRRLFQRFGRADSPAPADPVAAALFAPPTVEPAPAPAEPPIDPLEPAEPPDEEGDAAEPLGSFEERLEIEQYRADRAQELEEFRTQQARELENHRARLNAQLGKYAVERGEALQRQIASRQAAVSFAAPALAALLLVNGIAAAALIVAGAGAPGRAAAGPALVSFAWGVAASLAASGFASLAQADGRARLGRTAASVFAAAGVAAFVWGAYRIGMGLG